MSLFKFGNPLFRLCGGVEPPTQIPYVAFCRACATGFCHQADRGEVFDHARKASLASSRVNRFSKPASVSKVAAWQIVPTALDDSRHAGEVGAVFAPLLTRGR